MSKLFLSFLIASFLSLTALSANCGMKGMHKEKCNMPNCEMKMKSENCKCGMKKADCKMPNCKMDMKKSGSCGAGKCGAGMMKSNKGEMSGNAGKKMSGSCGAGKCGSSMKKMDKQKYDMPKMAMKANCDCKNGGECKCKAAGKECKCKAQSVKEEAKMCGCGMTQDSCKKMMISCKYRDAREAKEAQNK